MKLIKYENFKIELSEEASYIKAFRDLWQRDKTKNKGMALMEFGFIYFMYDPRSEYTYLIDCEDREREIRVGLGVPSTWMPDELVLKAIEIYKKLTVTPSSILLEATRKSIDHLATFLQNINLEDRDSRGRLVHSVSQIVSAQKSIPELIEKLTAAETALNKELMENSRMRGGENYKKVFEDGFQQFL